MFLNDFYFRDRLKQVNSELVLEMMLKILLLRAPLLKCHSMAPPHFLSGQMTDDYGGSPRRFSDLKKENHRAL
jgi:hypothetical protein